MIWERVPSSAGNDLAPVRRIPRRPASVTVWIAWAVKAWSSDVAVGALGHADSVRDMLVIRPGTSRRCCSRRSIGVQYLGQVPDDAGTGVQREGSS